MKNLFKLSALAAVVVASATYASAATMTLASGAGSATFAGYNSTAGTTFPTSLTATTNLGTFTNTPVVAIGTGGGVWVGPLAGSSWVSFTTTQPGGLIANNGDYVYTTTFNTTALGAGPLTGSMTILADDTVSVFLNGTALANEDEIAGGVGADGHCSAGVPSCNDPAGTTFNLAGLVSGTNTLWFVVEQTGLSATGLDYTATISSPTVPEPSTLLMLGTGLLGSAGTLFRRMRKS